jgi:glycosyltransferase involved in cell wall biosynthesis
MNTSFAVIIPLYNHGQTLPAVVADALRLGFPVIVVDDGSTDNGHLGIQGAGGVQLIRHQTNRGKGAALVSGFRAAHAGGAQWAITLDADGQHHPEDAEKLMTAITPSNRPIVVGCRQEMLNAGAPWTSRFGRGFSNFWVRLSGGPSTRDTQSGFRIYPLPEVLNLDVRARRYQYELEVLVKAARQGIAVVEKPIRVTYPPEGQRISHFRPFVDFCRNSATFSRLIFLRIFGRRAGR